MADIVPPFFFLKMKAERFKKPEPVTERGMCVKCGKNPQQHIGRGKYRSLCAGCHRRRHEMTMPSYRPYIKHRKDKCERCGFIPEHPCQLDVDHIDGNHDNDDPTNLQTLCANCHRLKTMQNQDWKQS